MRTPLSPTGGAALVAALCSALAATGCGDREDLDGRRRELPGLLDTAAERQRDLGDRRVALDLFDNSARLHVHRDGSLVVDLSGVSFVKYSDGGQRVPWLRGKGGGAATDGLGAELWVPLDGDPGGAERRLDDSLRIAWRARAAAPGQLVSVFLNENKLADVAMPSMDWSSYEITAPASAVVEGENKLRFYFRSAGEIGGARSAAAFRRVALGGTANVADEALTRGPHTVGDLRQASLSTAGAGRLSLYTTIPKDSPALVFAVAGAGKASVRVRADGGQGAELWSGQAGDGWSDHEVDLGAYAGKLVRLDLIGDGAVFWGRPVITAAPAPEREPGEAVYDHVVVWSVASLRADRAGRYGEHEALSLRARGPSSDPARGHAALVTGRRDAGDRIGDDAVTLAERLRRAGYATLMAADSSAGLETRGMARGFDERATAGSAADLAKKIREHIARHAGEQTFVYAATTETELPYTCNTEIPGLEIRPEKTASIATKARAGRWALSAGERRSVSALYDACVDDNVAAFTAVLAGLRELGVAERSAVILVGTSSAELFERGSFGRGAGLHDEGVLVPLEIVAPGLPGGDLELGVELVDVHATILELAGVAPDPLLHGESVLTALREPPALPQPVYLSSPGEGRALVLGDHKLVVPAQGELALYDLAADPVESASRSAERPIATRALRDVLAIAAAFEPVWSAVRWGSANDLAPAFAADQGQ